MIILSIKLSSLCYHPESYYFFVSFTYYVLFDVEIL
jgi:hypothetical protein